MSAPRRWIRLDVGWQDSEWLADLSHGARLGWVLLLDYAKSHGVGGVVKPLAPSVAAARWKIPAPDVVELIEAALRDNALTIEDGAWNVTGWDKYQHPDTRAAERMRRYRESTPRLSPLRRNNRNNPSQTVTAPVTRRVTETETETWTETVKKEPSVPKKAKSWKFCPADFQPSEAHRLLARQLTVNLEVELAKFRDHEYAKPKTDPGRAFATWLRTASEYKRNGNGQHATDWAADLNL